MLSHIANFLTRSTLILWKKKNLKFGTLCLFSNFILAAQHQYAYRTAAHQPFFGYHTSVAVRACVHQSSAKLPPVLFVTRLPNYCCPRNHSAVCILRIYFCLFEWFFLPHQLQVYPSTSKCRTPNMSTAQHSNARKSSHSFLKAWRFRDQCG